MNATPDSADSAVLVGKFFHTTTRCPSGARVPQLQGRIVGIPAPRTLLIETFSWIHGYGNGAQEFMALDEFIERKPMIYETADDMNFSYEHGALSHDCDRRRCHERGAGAEPDDAKKPTSWEPIDLSPYLAQDSDGPR